MVLSLLNSFISAFVPTIRTSPPFPRACIKVQSTRDGISKAKEQSSKEANDDSITRPSPQDLEHAFAETMWKMKILQEESEFMETRPSKLRDLFQTCQELVEVDTSTIPDAGKGLFASQRISAGSILTFYPVNAMGVNFADGSSFVHSRQGHDHTTSAYIMTLVGNRPIFGIDVENDFDGMGFVDADPSRQVTPAWQCHYINDGAIVAHNSPESVMEYYTASLKAQNAIFVPFGPSPLVAAVATQDIEKGQEIFTCYGRSYWLGLVEQDVELWSPRTEDIVLTEEKIANVLEEASDYIETKHAEEARGLYEAFADIA